MWYNIPQQAPVLWFSSKVRVMTDVSPGSCAESGINHLGINLGIQTSIQLKNHWDIQLKDNVFLGESILY